MGISINFTGKLHSVDLIDSLVAEIEDICTINNWSSTTSLTPFSEYPKLPDDDALAILLSAFLPKNLRGISFKVNKDSDPIPLYFNPEGFLQPKYESIFSEHSPRKKYKWISTKTQSLGVEDHIKVINLLKYLKKKYFKKFELKDEGGYYPRDNRKKLEERMNSFDNAQNVFRGFSVGAQVMFFPLGLLDKMNKALDKESNVIRDPDEQLRDTLKGMIDGIDKLEAFLLKKESEANMYNENDDDDDDDDDDEDDD